MNDAPIITANHLSWWYTPQTDEGEPVKALNELDFSILPGSFTGIIGPTGAGKSTLCMALTGIIPNPDDGTMRGTMTVAGRNTAECSIAELSSDVGYVQQDPESQLFCASVEDELAFPMESRGVDPGRMDERIDGLLHLVGMDGYRRRVPTSLSGGQMQRVAIAAALACHPRILVLDEPTAALDPEGTREVFQALDTIRAARELTIVMAQQDTDGLARYADRIMLLDSGSIAAFGDTTLFTTHRDKLIELGVALPGREPGPPAIVTDAAMRTGERQPAISFEHVTYRYPEGGNGSAALDDVNLAIDRGAFVGLIGCNGSGKTTLARHLNGMLQPSAGTVTVDGLHVGGRRVGEMASHVGYAFQNPDHQIFCSTTREEIAFGPLCLGVPREEISRRVDRLLSRFGLEDIAGQSPATLGYGQRRLVAFASVLAMHTPILVLDEPTAGLDRRLSGMILDAASQRCRQGTTVVMISHDMRTVRERCTYLIELEDGHVRAAGRIEPQKNGQLEHVQPELGLPEPCEYGEGH